MSIPVHFTGKEYAVGRIYIFPYSHYISPVDTVLVGGSPVPFTSAVSTPASVAISFSSSFHLVATVQGLIQLSAPEKAGGRVQEARLPNLVQLPLDVALVLIRETEVVVHQSLGDE